MAMYVTTYIREIREISFYAQDSTIQVLEVALHASVCLLLVLTSSASSYWGCLSLFTGATTGVTVFLPSKAVLRTRTSCDAR